MKAKAAVLYEYDTSQVVEEVEVEAPQEGEVMVKVAASGVCYSNYHGLKGAWPDQFPCPMILGDEGAGTVVEVGAGVKAVKPGDNVVLSWAPYCHNCFFCNRGLFQLCTTATTPSRFHKNGRRINNFSQVSSFAEYTVVLETQAIPLRPDVPLDKAAMVGCGVPTGWGAVVNTAKVEPGASVAVIGLGGIGLSAVMGAVTVNAEKIIGVDIKDNKLEMTRKFGVTHTINSTKEDVVNKIKELTDGLGVDYAFDTIGLPEVVVQALSAVRSGGTAVVVGANADWVEVSLSFSSFPVEKRLLGCLYGSCQPPVDIPRIIDLYMAGKLPLDQLITKRFPIEKINDAFDSLLKGGLARGLIEF